MVVLKFYSDVDAYLLDQTRLFLLSLPQGTAAEFMGYVIHLEVCTCYSIDKILSGKKTAPSEDNLQDKLLRGWRDDSVDKIT